MKCFTGRVSELSGFFCGHKSIILSVSRVDFPIRWYHTRFCTCSSSHLFVVILHSPQHLFSTLQSCLQVPFLRWYLKLLRSIIPNVKQAYLHYSPLFKHPETFDPSLRYSATFSPRIQLNKSTCGLIGLLVYMHKSGSQSVALAGESTAIFYLNNLSPASLFRLIICTISFNHSSHLQSSLPVNLACPFVELVTSSFTHSSLFHQ